MDFADDLTEVGTGADSTADGESTRTASPTGSQVTSTLVNDTLPVAEEEVHTEDASPPVSRRTGELLFPLGDEPRRLTQLEYDAQFSYHPPQTTDSPALPALTTYNTQRVLDILTESIAALVYIECTKPVLPPMNESDRGLLSVGHEPFKVGLFRKRDEKKEEISKFKEALTELHTKVESLDYAMVTIARQAQERFTAATQRCEFIWPGCNNEWTTARTTMIRIDPYFSS